MWRPPPPRSSQLLHLFLRFVPSTPSPPLPLRPPITLLPSSSPFVPAIRFLSTAVPPDLARTISAELVKLADTPSGSDSLDLPRHLSLHFSDVHFNTPLLLEILNASPAAGRAALDLYRWMVRHRSFTPTDESLFHLVHFFGRRKDFKAVHSLLSEFRSAAGSQCLHAALDRFGRAGRPTHAVRFFDDMERDYGIRRDRPALSALVTALCDHGFAGHAERVVKRCADEFFPDEEICNSLIRGWCSELKLKEARRLIGEILRGGFEIGTPAYNSLLDCVCRLCRKKDPLRLQPEAEKVLAEMESAGVRRDAGTFRVLISNLCKIRKTEDALKLFRQMGEWGCSPDADTHLVLIRSLYQAARISEGDEMIGWMRSAGFGKALDRKAYYGFVKILCGIERVEHAIKVFRMMKGYGHAPGIKTYDLLMGKLAAHNQVDRANALFKEAAARGVPVTPKVYKVDPRYVKVKEKKEKKRETLPEKMARKRRRLKKLRLSFVKKPKSMRRVI